MWVGSEYGNSDGPSLAAYVRSGWGDSDGDYVIGRLTSSRRFCFDVRSWRGRAGWLMVFWSRRVWGGDLSLRLVTDAREMGKGVGGGADVRLDSNAAVLAPRDFRYNNSIRSRRPWRIGFVVIACFTASP